MNNPFEALGATKKSKAQTKPDASNAQTNASSEANQQMAMSQFASSKDGAKTAWGDEDDDDGFVVAKSHKTAKKDKKAENAKNNNNFRSNNNNFRGGGPDRFNNKRNDYRGAKNQSFNSNANGLKSAAPVPAPNRFVRAFQEADNAKKAAAATATAASAEKSITSAVSPEVLAKTEAPNGEVVNAADTPSANVNEADEITDTEEEVDDDDEEEEDDDDDDDDEEDDDDEDEDDEDEDEHQNQNQEPQVVSEQKPVVEPKTKLSKKDLKKKEQEDFNAILNDLKLTSTAATSETNPKIVENSTPSKQGGEEVEEGGSGSAAAKKNKKKKKKRPTPVAAPVDGSTTAGPTPVVASAPKKKAGSTGRTISEAEKIALAEAKARAERAKLNAKKKDKKYFEM